MEKDEEYLSVVCHQHSDLLFLIQEMIIVLPQQDMNNRRYLHLAVRKM